MQNLKETRELYVENCQHESLFYSLNALYQTTIAQNKAIKILNGGKLSNSEREQMIKETEFLNSYKGELEDINKNIYAKLFDKASN